MKYNVGARRCTLPCLQTLSAEIVTFPPLSAGQSVHPTLRLLGCSRSTQVLHRGHCWKGCERQKLFTRCFKFTVLCCTQTCHVLLKVLYDDTTTRHHTSARCLSAKQGT